MNVTILIVLSVFAVLNLSLGVVALRYGAGREVRLFLLILIASFLWIGTNVVYLAAENVKFAAALVSYGAAATLSIGVFLFCRLLVEKEPYSHSTQRLIGLSSCIFVLLCTLPGVIGKSINEAGAIETNTVGLIIFGGVIGLCLIGGVAVLSEKLSNNRVRYVMYGLGGAAIVGLTFNLIFPVMDNYDYVAYGPMGTIIFVMACAYAIVRHGLFDVKTAAVRSAAYVVSLLSLALVYFGAAYLLSITVFEGSASTSVSVSPVNILLALLLAFIFQPVRRFFDRATNKIFFRDQYSVDAFITQIGEISTSTTSLHTLLKRASKTIKGTLKSSYATFIVHHKSHHDTTVGDGGDPRINPGERALLVGLFEKGSNEIYVSRPTDTSPGAVVAQRHGCTLIVPLGGVGFLLLGGQKSGGYTQRDLRALRAIQNELIIAVQNTRSLQEVRDLNTTLQMRIEEATRELRSSNRRLLNLDASKDEFMSIASHQLRTPLTSIKGYISMILDGDLGKVSPAQQKVLKEAFESSERMVSLIGDFLNVSRLQTGKFVIDHVETNLEELVINEVENLKQAAKSRQLTLRIKRPKEKLPMLYIDEIKVRQVVMNFIDNALYYTSEEGMVTVDISQRNGYAEVRVTDTGIGVPSDEQEQLFTKFFRATNAHKRRPDGTGVGLFLAKKVIDGHGGVIIFESKENKGSTFGFRLPITKLHTPPKW